MMNRLIVSLSVAVVGFLVVPVAGQGVILDQILVKVNGEIFTKTDLEQQQVEALQQQGKDFQKVQDLQNDEKIKAALAEITPDILVDAVDHLLLVQRGHELGLHLAEDQYKKIVAGVKKDNNIETDEQLVAGLKQQGMTLEQFRGEIEQRSIIDQVQQQEIMPKLNLTEEEAKEYYIAHPEEFRKPLTATIREILVAVPVQMQGGEKVTNAAADQAAAAKIQAVRQRVVAGEDFTKLVAEVSDSQSKATGGIVFGGPINLDQLSPALRDLIVKLKPGQVSEPVRMTAGYEIFRLEAMSDNSVQPFEQVRDQIGQKVYSSRAEVETKKYVEKLRATALIEWKNDDYRKMYEARLASRDAGGSR